ncbi:MAG: hypothetical protein U5L74_03965 [Ideonella sp.]|nr:hypothetical protein [Ideonella sp.]
MACIGMGEPSASDLPDYPFAPFKSGIEGKVRVQLTFTAPDQAPTLKVLLAPDDAEFEVSVRQHAKGLRVPCAKVEDLPFVLVRDYEFKKDSRKVFALDEDAERIKARRETLSCLRHATGPTRPELPSEARRKEVQGTVLVSYRFNSATEAPSFTVTAPRDLAPLRRAIEEWFGGMRLPCYDGIPVHGTVLYRFTFEGDAYGFKPGIAFKDFLALSSKSRLATLPRSSVDMACPFDVRLTYLMPHLPNRVHQVGNTDPRRKPLLDWFSALQLDLPKETSSSIFGDSTTFEVPCYSFK